MNPKSLNSWMGWVLAGLLGLQGVTWASGTGNGERENDVRADARALTEKFLAGDVEPVWARFGPAMKSALGSAETLKSFSDQVKGQLGQEESVLSENVEFIDGMAVYQRIGRWSGAPMPIVVQWAIAADGRVEGFHISPAPPGTGGPVGEHTPGASGELPDEASMAARLRAFVEEARTAKGVVAGVRDRNGRRFAGWGDAGDGDAPDEDTVFEAGSITKGLTGLLLARMIAAGEVAADQPIGTLLPTDLGLAPELAAITLEQLAMHQSGLPRLASGPEMQARMASDDPYAGSTPRELFDDLARVPPETVLAGRGRYAYSNLGTALLGQLLARAGDAPFETLIAERVFAPLELGMPVLDPHAVSGRRAAGARAGTPVPAWRMDAYAPMGAWQASARELLDLADRLLADDSPSWVETALRARPAAGSPGGVMGYGWHHGQVGQREIIWHNGGTAGNSSYLAIVPAERVAVAVLANAGGGVVDELARGLLRAGN